MKQLSELDHFKRIVEIMGNDRNEVIHFDSINQLILNYGIIFNDDFGVHLLNRALNLMVELIKFKNRIKSQLNK